MTDGSNEGGESKLAKRARTGGMRPVDCASKLFAATAKKKTPLTPAVVEDLIGKDPLVEKWATDATVGLSLLPLKVACFWEFTLRVFCLLGGR